VPDAAARKADVRRGQPGRGVEPLAAAFGDVHQGHEPTWQQNDMTVQAAANAQGQGDREDSALGELTGPRPRHRSDRHRERHNSVELAFFQVKLGAELLY